MKMIVIFFIKYGVKQQSSVGWWPTNKENILYSVSLGPYGRFYDNNSKKRWRER